MKPVSHVDPDFASQTTGIQVKSGKISQESEIGTKLSRPGCRQLACGDYLQGMPREGHAEGQAARLTSTKLPLDRVVVRDSQGRGEGGLW